MKYWMRWYRWLRKHTVGVIRFLYISPFTTLFLADKRLAWSILLLDAAISITYQAGSAGGWSQDGGEDDG